MRTIDRQTASAAVASHAGALAAVHNVSPDAALAVGLPGTAELPIGPFLTHILGEGDPRVNRILDAIGAYEDRSPLPPQDGPIQAAAGYEAETVLRGSASIRVPRGATNERMEVVVTGPDHGNPFVDVDLRATFSHRDRLIEVGGFYDGAGTYRIRFLPEAAGEWQLRTSSNARSLDAISVTFIVDPGSAPGAVRVKDEFHFAFADGSPFVPIGTTAYAWTHQEPEVQEQTLRTLATAPFTKIRMAIFPKSLVYNENEPEYFPFPRRASGGWDTTRFDLAFFANLERRIDQLADLGVHADLILFHPYDRWGFSNMGTAADDRYVTYVTRRLAAFPNVWWSMANEYDLMTSKRLADWTRLAHRIQADDFVGHPLSIHNWVETFDYATDWATHCSIQKVDHELGRHVSRWRRRWRKPVIVDESGYEGDIDQDWGNLTAQDLVRRFWETTMQGGYLTHGETFEATDDRLWWSKGGSLRGESAIRIAFLRRIIDESPTGRIDPLPSAWDFASAGADGYFLTYLGARRPSFRILRIPEGHVAQVAIIDTWDMTVDELPVAIRGEFRVELPAKPYMALRVRVSAQSPAR